MKDEGSLKGWLMLRKLIALGMFGAAVLIVALGFNNPVMRSTAAIFALCSVGLVIEKPVRARTAKSAEDKSPIEKKALLLNAIGLVVAAAWLLSGYVMFDLDRRHIDSPLSVYVFLVVGLLGVGYGAAAGYLWSKWSHED